MRRHFWPIVHYRYQQIYITGGKQKRRVSILFAGDYEYASVCIPTHRLNSPVRSGCIMYVHNGNKPTNVTIAMYSDTQVVRLEPGEVHKISFWQGMFPIDGAESKAIRLTSTEEIQVLVYKDSDDGIYQYNGVYQVSSDRANGTFFLTAASNKQTCSGLTSGNHFYLVSTFFDNTIIEVTYQNGSSFELTLPAFGTFTHVTFDYQGLDSRWHTDSIKCTHKRCIW